MKFSEFADMLTEAADYAASFNRREEYIFCRVQLDHDGFRIFAMKKLRKASRLVSHMAAYVRGLPALKAEIDAAIAELEEAVAHAS